MRTLEILLGGLIGLTALAVIMKDRGAAAGNILTSFGQFNEASFGMFLRG